MHKHKWHIDSKRESWKESPQKGLLMAYEVKIRRCDCGEERKIKTAPKGTWWKSAENSIERIKTYPEKWKKSLAGSVSNLSNACSAITLEKLRRINLTWAEAEELVESLVADGIAEKFEKYPKRNPKNIKIFISPDTVQTLRKLLGLDKEEKVQKEIDVFFKDWKNLNIKNAPEGNLIDQLADTWHDNKKPFLPLKNGTIRLKSFNSYKLILNTLKTIYSIRLSGETIYFRELSVMVSGNSKTLASLKPYLKNMLGNLEEYGIQDHSPIMFCRIPVTGTLNGLSIDLCATVDYTPLTLSTAKAFKPVNGDYRALLLVENLTTFETTIPHLPKDIGIIWLSGYPPSYVRMFVKKLLEFIPSPGFIWCDPDPDGMEIVLTAGKWFEEAGQKWKPVGMDKDILLNCKTSRDLDERDRNKIKQLSSRPDAAIFHETLILMEKTGKKPEQESINSLSMLQQYIGT